VRSSRKRGRPEGGIWYPASDVRVIDEISAAVIRRCIGLHFEDPAGQAEFATRLRGANIPYKSCARRGREYVYWEGQFEAQAVAIQDAVEDESMRRGKEQRERARNVK
jgi:hypothetical protein